jgi:hypothetical protein
MSEDQDPATGKKDDDQGDTGRTGGSNSADDADDDDDDDSGGDDSGTDDIQARIKALEQDRDKWKNLARKHETRARDNAGAASKVKSVDAQLQELRQQLAERDTADLERSGRLAMEKVRSGLADKGVKVDDVTDVLSLVDPSSTLLKDGDPDDEAIKRLVISLAKVAGRVRPDPDQGKRGGKAPPSMNELIRRARGHST